MSDHARGRTRRPVFAALVPLLLATLAPVSAVAATAESPAPPRASLADGSWSLSYFVDLRIAGALPGGMNAIGRGSVTGTGTFEVKGGGVAGAYSGGGTASTAVSVPGTGTGPATLNLAIAGAVAGTAAKPVLQGTVHASGTVSVDADGLSRAVPVVFDGVLGDGAGAALTMRSVGCGEASGDWSVSLGGQPGALPGPAVTGDATFVAIRTDDASGTVPDSARQISQLLSDADTLVARVEGSADGTAPGDPPGAEALDVDALDALLERAEAVARSLPALDECDARGPAAPGYVSVLPIEMDRLLGAATGHLAQFDTIDLVRLIGAGYRSTAIGSTATWSGAPSLERALRTELGHRLDAAVAARDARLIVTIAVTSRQVAWTRLARRATRAIAGATAGAGAIAAVTGTTVTGSRARPVLGWQPASGAARYQVVVLGPDRRPYWAWQGAAATVRVGGGAAPPHLPGPRGPRVAKGSDWSVAAFDASGQVIAASGSRPVTPS